MLSSSGDGNDLARPQLYTTLIVMSYDAILFDLDNTLYDYDAYWTRRLTWALEPLRTHYPDLNVVTLIEQAIQENIYAAQLPAFLQRIGINDTGILTTTQARYRVNTYEDLRLFSDVTAVLTTLRTTHKLGLITNGPTRTQRPKIKQFGLAEYMQIMLVSEEVGIAKPDPAIFDLALTHLNVPEDRAVFVGDSPEYDLRGAHAAGIAFVWMNRHNRHLPPGMPSPLASIKQVSELLGLVSV